jgi:RNA polymerase sigma-70 factor (ECF subfamily)
VLRLTIAGDRIAGVEAVADAERLGQLDVELLEPQAPS